MAISLYSSKSEETSAYLDILVVELATNHALNVKDGPEKTQVSELTPRKMHNAQSIPFRIRSILILRRITNKTLVVIPRNVRRCDTVSLVVCNDLDLSRLHNGDT